MYSTTRSRGLPSTTRAVSKTLHDRAVMQCAEESKKRPSLVTQVQSTCVAVEHVLLAMRRSRVPQQHALVRVLAYDWCQLIGILTPPTQLCSISSLFQRQWLAHMLLESNPTCWSDGTRCSQCVHPSDLAMLCNLDPFFFQMVRTSVGLTTRLKSSTRCRLGYWDTGMIKGPGRR
jgi:hypothetical protein